MLIYFYFCIWIYNCFIPFVERISFLPVFPLYPCPKSTVHKYVTLFLHFLYYPVDQFPCFDTIVCVCAHLLSHIQLCKPGSSDLEFSLLEISLLEFSSKNTGAVCHFLAQGDLPNPGISPTSLASPPLAGRFFTIALFIIFM